MTCIKCLILGSGSRVLKSSHILFQAPHILVFISQIWFILLRCSRIINLAYWGGLPILWKLIPFYWKKILVVISLLYCFKFRNITILDRLWVADKIGVVTFIDLLQIGIMRRSVSILLAIGILAGGSFFWRIYTPIITCGGFYWSCLLISVRDGAKVIVNCGAKCFTIGNCLLNVSILGDQFFLDSVINGVSCPPTVSS